MSTSPSALVPPHTSTSTATSSSCTDQQQRHHYHHHHHHQETRTSTSINFNAASSSPSSSSSSSSTSPPLLQSAHHPLLPSSSSSCTTTTATSSSSSSSSSQPKKRTRVTPSQLTILEETFSVSATPDSKMRKHLAQKLQMPERSIQIWFQNRRAKVKMLQKRALMREEQEAAKARLYAEATAYHHPYWPAASALGHRPQTAKVPIQRAWSSDTAASTHPHPHPHPHPLPPPPPAAVLNNNVNTNNNNNNNNNHLNTALPPPSHHAHTQLSSIPQAQAPSQQQQQQQQHLQHHQQPFAATSAAAAAAAVAASAMRPPFPPHLSSYPAPFPHTPSFYPTSHVSTSAIHRADSPSISITPGGMVGEATPDQDMYASSHVYSTSFQDSRFRRIDSEPAPIMQHSLLHSMTPDLTVPGIVSANALTIGTWHRMKITPPDLLCHYLPVERVFSWHIRDSNYHFKMMVSFDSVLSIELDTLDDDVSAEIHLDLSDPPLFFMETTDATWIQCSDFTEAMQATHTLRHSIRGLAVDLRQDLLNIASIDDALCQITRFPPTIELGLPTAPPSATTFDHSLLLPTQSWRHQSLPLDSFDWPQHNPSPF